MPRYAITLCTGFLLACSLLVAAPGRADQHDARPNILWITSEDNAAHWLGCYGNEDAQTPRIDELAAGGLRFTHAYSNAPVCAVARSTILNGAYAVTQGTQHMRSRYRVPERFKPYVAYLREAGYYCSNQSKTDFNFEGDDRRIWDACSGRAHYKDRAVGQPFFAIFNSTVSHESSLFPERVRQNRERGVIPNQTRLDGGATPPPPYLPDLPAVRSDIAIYHDNLTALDSWVGELLDELQSRGLAEETIVFYYSDHGGPTPRGKRYLANTGVQVPLVVHVPEKWRSLAPFAPGETVDELVAFVDLAPTLLSLAGIETPSQMQGRAFLGPHRTDPADDAVVFLYADRFDEIYGMRRGLTDGRFKYIRCFTPHLPAAPYSEYSLSMPSWIAWRDAWRAGKLPAEYAQLWEQPQAVEQLFNTEADPWETKNLASDPAHAARLESMRDRLRATMAETYDTGLVPEALFPVLANEGTISDYVHSADFDFQQVLRLAFLASAGKPENLPELTAALSEANPCAKYWGALGCTILGPAAEPAAGALGALLTDAEATVRVAAACAMHAIGHRERAKAALLAELEADLIGPETLMLANALVQIDALDSVPEGWARTILDDPNANEYTKRLAKRIEENSDPE